MDEPTRMGRPRPLETIQRDERVRALLADGKARSRNEIADALGEPPHQVYLSLWRLREAGEVTRPDETGRRYLWVAVT